MSLTRSTTRTHRPDQDHPWLKALRREGVFFSSPLDIDFAMLEIFPDVYQKPRPGGRGPKKSANALEDKKNVTLKTEGDPDLYDDGWDDSFHLVSVTYS